MTIVPALVHDPAASVGQKNRRAPRLARGSPWRSPLYFIGGTLPGGVTCRDNLETRKEVPDRRGGATSAPRRPGCLAGSASLPLGPADGAMRGGAFRYSQPEHGTAGKRCFGGPPGDSSTAAPQGSGPSSRAPSVAGVSRSTQEHGRRRHSAYCACWIKCFIHAKCVDPKTRLGKPTVGASGT